MNNPINYDCQRKKYFVWVARWHIEYMKLFDSAELARAYIESHPAKCVRIKDELDNNESQRWVDNIKNEAHEIEISEKVKETRAIEQNKSPKSDFSVSIMIFIALFVVASIFNYTNNRNEFFVTLISSFVQAVGILLVVGIVAMPLT